MRFSWDPAKARSNRAKHGVTFDEAAETFADPLALIVEDVAYGSRFVLVGCSTKHRLLFTVYAEHGDDEIRIISARRTTNSERKLYEGQT